MMSFDLSLIMIESPSSRRSDLSKE